MSILHVPVTASNLVEWVRRAAGAINQLITGKQDQSDNLDSIAALALTGNSGDAIVVNGTEDGFELVAGGGGGGTTTNALTMNNGGAGAASGTTFDGSVARTISYNTVGAAASGHNHDASYQPLDADLTSIAALTTTAYGRALLELANAAALRTAGGLVIGTDVLGMGGGTLTGDLSVPAEAYGAGWNGSNEAPTKNDVYDKIESLSGGWRLAGGAYTAAGLWDQAVDGSVATVDFTGLAGVSEIMLISKGVTKSISGDLNVRASVNNGSSYYGTSGDYVFLSAAGVETNSTDFGTFHSTAATAARSGVFRVLNANVGLPVGFNIIAGNNHRLFVASTSAINAIRALPSAGGNLTGGKIYCLVR